LFYDWDWFQYLGNNFTNGTNGTSFINDEQFCNGNTLNSTLVCDEINFRRTFAKIEAKDFDFHFLYLDGLDDTGHEFSWGSPAYEAEIGVLDYYLGEIIAALNNTGILNSTYIVLTSDHGGRVGTE